VCTLVALLRPGHEWPLILGANRDEREDRPWRGPGRHWPDRPRVLAGLDERARGSWLGTNDDGLVAAVMNRAGSLGTEPGKRSRGELVLKALDHSNAGAAARALADGLDPESYRPFNLFVGDALGAFWLRHTVSGSAGAIETVAIPPGLSLLTDHDLNDLVSPRIRAYLPRFRAAAKPDPGTDDWAAWIELLASPAFEDGEGPAAAMNVRTDVGFGTLSSALIALARPGRAHARPVWRFAAGPPHLVPFVPVMS